MAISTFVRAHLVSAPKLWPAGEFHVRHAGWSELFFDLVFAAAISQLSSPLNTDYSISGIVRYAFLLALIFLAWLGYTNFSTHFAVDDFVERALIVAQIFLVAVMAANCTMPLASNDAAGFGAAYGGVRIILALQYARAARIAQMRSLSLWRMAGLLAAAAVWIVSALLPAPLRYFFWAFAFALDLGNSWPPIRNTITSPPGAAHFPERFGLLTVILLGEFVASVMRGIQSQEGWSILAASAAVLSVALGFAIWSCYSDGAASWQPRLVEKRGDVRRLRIWIGLHFLLFLGIGVLAVGVHRAIALAPGASFIPRDQFIICGTTAGLILVVGGLATTATQNPHRLRSSVLIGQIGLAATAFALGPFSSQILPSILILLLIVCLLSQAALLLSHRRVNGLVAEI